ncbi:hypothetical protein QQS21_009681 [Conoideocrella luteorostrata]|uniref:Uncharacterized protein n=1 Tax=Conoideocrella luteorostrata TaxID=1105319 RepID=A0AAJ0FQ37_9HYPO|nr:hypothetical protein QQS21_009681 [Conoideocrella luteorostrata]
MRFLKDAAKGAPFRGVALVRKATRVTPLRTSILCVIFLAYYFRFSIFDYCDYVRQVQPWSGQRQIEQHFEPSENELACLRGTPLTNTNTNFNNKNTNTAMTASSSQADTIPNVVHFIYIFREPLALKKGLQFDFLSYLAIRSALVSMRPSFVFLHYAFVHKNGDGSSKMHLDPLSNPWIRRLRNDIHLVEHQLGDVRGKQIPHLADVMRLQILRDNGGIYLDIDTFALQPFTNILNPPRPHDIVLGHEGGNRWGLCNAAIVARKNSTFIHQWIYEYEHGQSHKQWNYKGVVFPKQLADKLPGEICTLPPDAFFWPTWTWNHVEWMHEELDAEQAKHWKEVIRKNGGALFEGQLAYHAWSQMSAKRFLNQLTPEVVRWRDTRFNLLMRRFLEDDV